MYINRLLSLDVFRGLVIALMIIVNSPGNQTSYTFLQHSTWHGCTLADLVFPFFLFIMGVSITFSLSDKQNIPQSILLGKILKRSIILFTIGLFLNAFPHFNIHSLRIFGVLQRIAICYFVAALLFMKTRIRTQAIILLSILIGYSLLMVSQPGQINYLSPENNIATRLDHLLFSSAHLYHQAFEPEGLLSTLPAIATTLLGNLTGYLLYSKLNPQNKFKILLGAGISTTGIGWYLGLFLPINKGLWTSSYVLWTGGLTLLSFAFLYWLIDIKKIQRWSLPLEILGLNAITAYVLHVILLKIQNMVVLSHPDGLSYNLRTYLTHNLFYWTSPNNASLLYAISYMFFWLLILTLLYRQKIIVKI